MYDGLIKKQYLKVNRYLFNSFINRFGKSNKRKITSRSREDIIKNGKTLNNKQIENGEIKAVIDQEKGMVLFKEDTIEFNSLETKKILDTQIENGIKLFNRIKNMNNEIERSQIYLSKVMGIKDESFFDSNMMMNKMGKMKDIYY
jgi:hypothetical protein